MRKRTKKKLAILLSITLIVSGLVLIPKSSKKVVLAAEEGLLWSDEFNGTSLDKSVWTCETGNGNWGWGNGEVQYYTDRTDNVDVAGGCLKITAKKENYRGYKYTSGRLITKANVAALYGRMEARMKIVNGNQDGIWPAFWMMGNNMKDGVGWPNCGEIDIMEHANSNSYVSGCLHWNTAGINAPYSSDTHGSYGSGYDGARTKFGYFTDNVNNGINGWHTYGLLWDENHMEWQLDGETFFSQSITNSNAYCFQKEQFFLLNLAIGGPQTGFTNQKTANAETFRTTTMYVDYVRVYQYNGKGSVNGESETIGEPQIDPLVEPPSDDPEITTSTPTTEEITTSPESTTVSPESKTVSPETITYYTYKNVDAVAEKNMNFTTYQGTSWADGAAISSEETSPTGAVINVSNTGNNLWGLQAHSEDLRVAAGHTYRLKTTLTSTIDKSVRVKVRGNDSDDFVFFDETISLLANEPYTIDKDVVIPDDFSGTVDIDYGFGQNNYVNEKVPKKTMTFTISDTSFKTNERTVHYEIVTKGESSTKNNSDTKVEIAKVKVGKAIKKKAAKSIKIKLKKKLGSVNGYQVFVFKTRKNAKNKKKILLKRTCQKNKKTFKIRGKKLKNKKKLFVRVRGYRIIAKKKYFGKWSAVRKVKIK